MIMLCFPFTGSRDVLIRQSSRILIWPTSRRTTRQWPSSSNGRKSFLCESDQLLLDLLDPCSNTSTVLIWLHTLTIFWPLHGILTLETQALHLVDQLHSGFRHSGTRIPSVPKPFIDENIWDVRTAKLRTKKRLRALHKHRVMQLIMLCFATWRTGDEDLAQH